MTVLAIANALLAVALFSSPSSTVEVAPSMPDTVVSVAPGAVVSAQVASVTDGVTRPARSAPRELSVECVRAVRRWASESADGQDWRAANGDLEARQSHPYQGYTDEALQELQANDDPEAYLEAGRRFLREHERTGDSFQAIRAEGVFERAATLGLPLAYMNTARRIQRRADTEYGAGQIGPEEHAFRLTEAEAYRQLISDVVEGLPVGVFASEGAIEPDNGMLQLMRNRYVFFREDKPELPSIRLPLPEILSTEACSESADSR